MAEKVFLSINGVAVDFIAFMFLKIRIKMRNIQCPDSIGAGKSV